MVSVDVVGKEVAILRGLNVANWMTKASDTAVSRNCNSTWLPRRARLLETVLVHDGRPPSCVVDIGQDSPGTMRLSQIIIEPPMRSGPWWKIV